MVELKINFEEKRVRKETIEKVLDALYTLEDNLCYRNKSVSKAIETLENVLYPIQQENNEKEEYIVIPIFDL